ncbi:MAG: N-acetyl-alpha-D-glucosaminyl L-malate synthase BshA [Gemmatimonadetes bacterium]|nr:N-acetyl-alpha-D-glucosaminyl L-malate synthase BshA [Gemmatimonadota bacterium]
MKIAITCYPTYGGSGAVATELGLALAEREHEVHFISYAQPFRLEGFHDRVFFHEVEMEHYPLFEHPPYPLALAVSIYDVAEKYGLDLVHAHYAIPHATSAWIATEMFEGRPSPRIVTTLHGTDITLVGQHPSFHSITRFSTLKSDGITAVSEYLRRETEKSFGVEGGRIRVIPNFVDTDRYRRDRKPCHRASLAPKGHKVLMHVSNFREVKRVEDVVEVYARVRRRIPSTLVMVGDGPDRPRATQRAKALGIADDVLFLGKHSSVDELLACADLFLLPSESESFGLAALEALACGTPVVASRTGGLPEVVDHGESGYLFPVGDVEAMAEGAIEILSSKETWKRMSEAGRRIAEERFASHIVVPRYEAHYEEVLSPAPTPQTSPAGKGRKGR